MTLTLPEVFVLAVALAKAAAVAGAAYLRALWRQLVIEHAKHTALGAFIAMCGLGLAAVGVSPWEVPGV